MAGLTQKFNKIQVSRVFLIVGIFEGVASLYFLFKFPASRSRSLILGGWGLVILALMIAATLFRWSQSKTALFVDNYLLDEKKGTWIQGISLLIVYLGLFFWMATILSPTFVIKGYLDRLVPLLGWIALLCGQLLIGYYLLGFPTKETTRSAYGIVAMFIFPLLLLGLVLIIQIDPDFYIEITKEDHFVEWLTVVFLFGAGSFYIASGVHGKKAQSRYAWFFFLLGFGSFLMAMEEISWGQRIFGLETNQFFLENNVQQELNLHNAISPFLGIKTAQVAALVLFSYGVLLPLLALIEKFAAFFKKIKIPIPSLFPAVGFLLGSVLTLNLFSGREKEISEMLLSLSLLFISVLEVLKSPLDAQE